jgi:hypothetical protein
MSMSLRPVREDWGTHSSSFCDDPVNILSALTNEFTGGNHGEESYGDLTVVWISDGKTFLDRLHAMNRDERHQLAVKFAGEYDEDVGDVDSLLSNMRNLANEWRGMLGSDGSLRFYVD